jgi:hypothetical protein
MTRECAVLLVLLASANGCGSGVATPGPGGIGDASTDGGAGDASNGDGAGGLGENTPCNPQANECASGLFCCSGPGPCPADGAPCFYCLKLCGK